jgi:hypothetical protein
MATPDELPDDVRKSVARQVGRFVGGTGGEAMRAAAAGGARAAGKPPSKLEEGYARVTVSVPDVLNPPADPARLLEPTGAWTHAVRGSGVPHVAVSVENPFDAGSHEVIGVFAGRVAEKIDAAAAWLDETDKDDDAVVRLLDFPAFYTLAFGILRGKKAYAVLVDQPDANTGLKYEKEYTLKDFLARLAKEPHT